ncbi:uncharacterized membrane protein YsdA (DUF1294 family) [Flavobacterium nitrogenifigens]|uniref:Uncharacterized membrane protein YsdA (DUF1294 family) n=2 Tax=Flavobacterium TaxID=237 RepID=A0A7W7IVC6_9FLAO|nr:MULTISPECIES: DUF1294 domain-containing protein [Flavobacterium]MBB4800847.1 uncharacterized membrane protein YsdA (DUF1294 family) [Flavobacterium nitrogenifigens]MBB6385405.1 uncharacterized membrane protein YsdA (DUF1294 family) [Flavobacterium notoginsengisoli]
MKVLLLYFLFVNCFTFLLAGYDKFQARRHRRRIPESVLFIMAFIGGSVGLLIGMFFFRHKTAKTTFIMKFSYIILVQIVVIYLKMTQKI